MCHVHLKKYSRIIENFKHNFWGFMYCLCVRLGLNVKVKHLYESLKRFRLLGIEV